MRNSARPLSDVELAELRREVESSSEVEVAERRGVSHMTITRALAGRSLYRRTFERVTSALPN